MTPPHFEPSDFIESRFSPTTQKAQFANRLVRLIAGDFKPSLFTKALYADLVLSFGFIAHYDRDGFYSAQLSTLPRRIEFLQTLYRGGIYASASGPTGDPSIGRADVERAFYHQPWLAQRITHLKVTLAQTVAAGERADLRRLAHKYPDELATL